MIHASETKTGRPRFSMFPSESRKLHNQTLKWNQHLPNPWSDGIVQQSCTLSQILGRFTVAGQDRSLFYFRNFIQFPYPKFSVPYLQGWPPRRSGWNWLLQKLSHGWATLKQWRCHCCPTCTFSGHPFLNWYLYLPFGWVARQSFQQCYVALGGMTGTHWNRLEQTGTALQRRLSTRY